MLKSEKAIPCKYYGKREVKNVMFNFWNLYMEIDKLNMTISNGTFGKGFNFYYLNIIQVLSLKILVIQSILPIT